jgi:tight adherence protein C
VIILLPLLAFLFASLLVTAAALALSPNAASTIEQRLGEVTGMPMNRAEEAVYGKALVDTLKRIGNMAPRSSKEVSKLKQRLIVACFRNPEALIVFFGIRIGVALAAFALFATPVIRQPSLLVALSVCAVGYVLPSMVLARMAKRRQHRIRLGLPDALDLLVVSVEAGLGLDQALRLINLEMRAGTARAEALHNLAERTGVDDVQSLVAMLVQTDKFGTSVSQSLRVHSETVRTKRRQRAEEAAAKTGVKLVFPLVFCIFPAIWVVTIGPAAIKFIEVIVPMGGK